MGTLSRCCEWDFLSPASRVGQVEKKKETERSRGTKRSMLSLISSRRRGSEEIRKLMYVCREFSLDVLSVRVGLERQQKR